MSCTPSTPFSGASRYPIERTQRYPQYSFDEMEPFFEQVAAGYCWEQSADRCRYVRAWVRNSLYSHDSLMDRLLDLAAEAGARIRSGEFAVPDRRDGLYDKYRGG